MMTKQIDELMALADEYAKAWHANQTSRLIAAYDDGHHRKALKRLLETALNLGEPYGCVTVVKRPGCADQHWFYRHPESPYIDNAAECHTVYAIPPLAE
jgi:hypothetical protein